MKQFTRIGLSDTVPIKKLGFGQLWSKIGPIQDEVLDTSKK